MSRTPRTLVIDARPRGPSGLLAERSVLGRPVIDHLVELAEAVAGHGPPVAIHAREGEHGRLALLLAARPSARYRLAFGAPPEDSAVLRSDRVYDARKLRKALRRGRDIESAAIWRLDRPVDLAGAEDEVTRRHTYQPIGRYWATGPATALARRLAPTRIRPNALTLVSGSLMIGSAGLVAFGEATFAARLSAALMMATALVLDSADGHLARLQGTASAFGRWLDANLDELGDLTLHLAAAWAAYARTGQVGWILLGSAYVTAKYLFLFGTLTAPATLCGERSSMKPQAKAGLVRRFAHALGHADLRWHSWIALAAIGRLEIGLAIYTPYFAARAIGGAVRKAKGAIHAA